MWVGSGLVPVDRYGYYSGIPLWTILGVVGDDSIRLMKMPLSRHYGNVVAKSWLGTHEFTGVVERNYPDRLTEFYSCYGWTKTGGRTFFIYKIENGHIQKLGSVKGEEVEK